MDESFERDNLLDGRGWIETVEAEKLLSKCVSIDLEVDPNTGRSRSFAAIHPATTDIFNYRGGDLATALGALDEYASGAEFVLGHNVIKHDLLHLQEARSDLQILTKPPIDTLWLNPLAFPRNPYHHLVKHYKDGRLQADRASDPELDAGLVLTVLRNQLNAFRELGRSDPNLLTALHWLVTMSEKPEGFEKVFQFVRHAPKPAAKEAQCAIRQILAGRACAHQIELAIPEAERDGWPLAYAISWIWVAGENSVMPPWVRHQFPKAGDLVRRLRDTSCTDPACDWCRSWTDPTRLLEHERKKF